MMYWNREYGPNLPKGEGAEYLTELMRKRLRASEESPGQSGPDKKRSQSGEYDMDLGSGKKAVYLTPFKEKYGIDGAVISAVDLIKGIAVCSGLAIHRCTGRYGDDPHQL